MNNQTPAKNNTGTFVFIFVCIALLSSCSWRAKDPDLMVAKQVDTIDYSALSCEQLNTQEQELQARYDTAYNKQNAEYTRSRRYFRAAIIAGLLVGPIWGFLGFGVKGDPPGTPEEISLTLGSLQQLAAEKLAKSC